MSIRTYTRKNRQRLYLADSMDDKQTRIKDHNEARSEGEDVFEAQGRMIWMKSIQQLLFGTVGTGLEFGSLVWPKGRYILRIENKDLCQKFHGRPTAEQSVVVGRMNAMRLRKSNLDCQLVDGTTIDWSLWLGDVANDADPNVIICIAPDRRHAPVMTNKDLSVQPGTRECDKKGIWHDIGTWMLMNMEQL
jgi:hypothetical protein